MERIDERLSLEEMIKLARTAKKWRCASCYGGKDYWTTINSGNGNHLTISLGRFLLFFNAIEVYFNNINNGFYAGTNKELRKIRKEVGYKCLYQAQVDQNNQISRALDHAKALLR